MEGVYAAIDVVSDLLVVTTVLLTALFVIFYVSLFNPAATTVGKIILRVMLALFVLGVMSIVRGLLPGVPEWWPLIRLAVWGYLSYSFGSLVWVLVMRKFWPDTLRIRPRD